MTQDKHTLLDGKLHVYRRPRSSRWQCSTFLGGRNHRESTKETNLALAMEFAREWYALCYASERRRRQDAMAGRLAEQLDGTVQPYAGTGALTDRRRTRTPKGPTFGDACKAFLEEAAVMTQGERNADYTKGKRQHIDLHLLSFFGNDTPVTEISAGRIQEYRVHRQTSRIDPRNGEVKRPARSTLHNETVTLRQVLKTANRKGWIAALPDMTIAYKASGKVKHRAWFSPTEYKLLYEATRERAQNATPMRKKIWEDLHDYVLFMANTGLRPDECTLLEHRDVTIVKDAATGERILEIEVRGKRGVGHNKSTTGAVHPYQRVCKRHSPQPTDRVFGRSPGDLFNVVLNSLNLKRDRDGNVRTTYSLRHTYICLRLMEGADIYQIAKNCRTSVKMIEEFYASHIKNTLDAAAINVRRSKPSTRALPASGARKPRGRPPAGVAK